MYKCSVTAREPSSQQSADMTRFSSRSKTNIYVTSQCNKQFQRSDDIHSLQDMTCFSLRSKTNIYVSNSTQLYQLNKQTTIQKKSKKNIFIYLGNRAKHMTCFSLKQNQYLCISNSTPSATDKQTIQKKWWYTVIHNTARRIWLVCLWSKTNVFVNPLTQLSQCSSRLLFFPKVLADSLLNFFTTVIG